MITAAVCCGHSQNIVIELSQDWSCACRVIKLLVEAQRSRLPRHIPYRDSRLTFLLQVPITDLRVLTCSILACLHAHHTAMLQTGTLSADCKTSSGATQVCCTLLMNSGIWACFDDGTHNRGLTRMRPQHCECTSRFLHDKAMNMTLGAARRSPWVAMQRQ